MRLPAPDPRQLRDFAANGLQSGRDAFAILTRIATLLDTAEAVLDRFAGLISRLEQDERRARTVVDLVEDARQQAVGVIDRTTALRDQIGEALDEWTPTLRSARPAQPYQSRRMRAA